MSDPHVGHLTYIRVYSGRRQGRATRSSTRTGDRKERIGRLLQMHANKREELEEVCTGDIVAVVGLKSDRDRRDALRPAASRSFSSPSSSPSR